MAEDMEFSGDYEPLYLVCPKCSSKNVVVAFDNEGYFQVAECNKCGYKNKIPAITH